MFSSDRIRSPQARRRLRSSHPPRAAEMEVEREDRRRPQSEVGEERVPTDVSPTCSHSDQGWRIDIETNREQPRYMKAREQTKETEGREYTNERKFRK